MTERQNPPQRRHNREGGKIIPALCNIIGVLLILAVIALLIPTTFPRIMGYQVYNVVSGSMAPTIPQGSMIFVESADWQEIAVGDVIAFQSGGSVVTHRVTEIHRVEGEFTTKGDANTDEDINKVDFDLLVGKVVWHIPVLGEVSAHLTTAVGKLYLFGLILCGLLFNVLAGRLRNA